MSDTMIQPTLFGTVDEDPTKGMYHRNDPDTSRDAARQQSKAQKTEVQEAILTLLREHPEGLTAFKASELYFRDGVARGWPVNIHSYSVNRRMSELHTAEKIVDTGRRGPASTANSTAAVWALA